MSRIPSRAVLAAVLLVPTLLPAAPVPKEKAKEPARSERVDKLFGAMRDGKYDGFRFPDLRTEDIPALLELTDSTQELTNFPVNPISSATPPKSTSEGAVALWLVEGVRRGGKFPTLNTPHGTELKAQPELAKAYKVWWAKVKDKPEEVGKIDPLAETKLDWHRLGDRP